MGSAAGALKTAARRVGVSVEEYAERRADGQKWCVGHGTWHPTSSFATDRSRGDGLTHDCTDYRNGLGRSRYEPRPRPEPGRRFVAARDDDRLQARRRVNYLVEAGLLPRPDDLPCSDCGHVVGDGRRHEYDHHLGYAAEHHEDVEAVCTRCHHEREARRDHGR